MIYCIGNGGSMCVAIHLAEDLMSVGVPANALDNISRITAIANDFGYEQIFSRQLKEMKANNKDVLFAFSVSGNSENIIEAVKYANKIRMYTIGITSKSGGQLPKIVKTVIQHPSSNDFGIVEDFFSVIVHKIKNEIKNWSGRKWS